MYNTGASVLGVLLARATGQSFGDVLRTRIFEPLGMTQTAFWAREPGRLAAAYRPASGAAGPGGLEIWDAPDGAYSRTPAFEDGAGGLVSTAGDMLAFARTTWRVDPVRDLVTIVLTQRMFDSPELPELHRDIQAAAYAALAEA